MLFNLMQLALDFVDIFEIHSFVVEEVAVDFFVVILHFYCHFFQ